MADKPNGKSTPKLHTGRVKVSSFVRRHLFADIPAGTPIELLNEPSYWAHHVAEIRPLDLIEAVCEDGSWEALFRVMFVATGEVKLSLVYEARHDQVTTEEHDTHAVVWKGPVMKFAVIRKDDGSILQGGFYPKSAALDHLRQHLRNIRA